MQTLLHVLNNCEVALKLRRYNQRHDRVLDQITKLAQTHLADTYYITADLSEDRYHFPSHITPTNLRPDLVLWSDVKRRLYIVELTICFESGYKEAAAKIVIGPSHTLVHELSGSNLAHTRHDHTYPQSFTLTLLLLEYQ